jgi:hypothetical protein
MVISDVAVRCRCSRVFAVLPGVFSCSLPVHHVTISSVCLSVHRSPGAGLFLMNVAALVLTSTSATPAHSFNLQHVRTTSAAFEHLVGTCLASS